MSDASSRESVSYFDLINIEELAPNTLERIIIF